MSSPTFAAVSIVRLMSLVLLLLTTGRAVGDPVYDDSSGAG